MPVPHTLPVPLEMVGTGRITGTVVDPEGRPVVGPVTVHLDTAEGPINWGGAMQVQDGKFEFKHVPPAKYRIGTHPNLPGIEEAEGAAIITVKVGQATEVKLVHREPAARRPRPAATRPAKSQ